MASRLGPSSIAAARRPAERPPILDRREWERRGSQSFSKASLGDSTPQTPPPIWGVHFAGADRFWLLRRPLRVELRSADNNGPDLPPRAKVAKSSHTLWPKLSGLVRALERKQGQKWRLLSQIVLIRLVLIWRGKQERCGVEGA